MQKTLPSHILVVLAAVLLVEWIAFDVIVRSMSFPLFFLSVYVGEEVMGIFIIRSSFHKSCTFVPTSL